MTVIEALTQATADLRDAVVKVLGIETRLNQKFDANTLNVQAIINTFNTRPLYTFISVDPASGNDANDGSSPAKAKRTLDGALASIGSQGVCILLFGDDTIRRRHYVNTNVQIIGVQAATNAAGYIQFGRNISFLGTALNSPGSDGGTYSAGVFFGAGSLISNGIVFILPDVPGNLSSREHFVSTASVNVQALAATIVVGSQQAAALFGSFNGGRLIVTINPILGPGAAGHVFGGIAAGADPNANWSYSTNLKSA